ncbi:MAG: Rib/alpha-like domain-containing protein, partial [Streptococcus mitis]|nr:Rib/alpha-like domain-containing protein [Streptococcus mitis]
VTVEVPVNVTPITPIETPVTNTPLTPEDYTKGITFPEGGKVTNVENIPDLTTPGKKDPVKVTVELPNGIRFTVNIPVVVTPKVTPVVVPVGTPVTPEDVQKHIELPNGWKVTKVGEIPTTTTPGTKPVVPVEIELPDGRKITVDVPVIVTPTVRQIVVPQGTPITPDDVKGHIDLPKEPGWEIVEVGEIPTTIPAGVKPSVKVKIKVPTGEIVEVEVPIIVTPKVTPIVVEVGTPITKEDVIKKVGLPEGWEIVEVGEIPTTSTPGTKPVVKVKVKLPDGRIITVEVPVTVTPKSQNGGGVISQNGDSTVQIVTEYLDENGNRITSDKEGKHNPIELEGYEFSHSTTDAKGNTLHHYKKVTNPINQEQPSAPETPTSPEKPVATPVQTSSTDSQQVSETTVSNDKKELPNTGTEDKAGLASLGLLGMLGAFGLVARKKKED